MERKKSGPDTGVLLSLYMMFRSLTRMRELILSIDQGTTSTRAMTFDKRGILIHSAFCEFPQIYPHPGWVEHDPEDIFDSVVTCINKLALGTDDRIISVGITNQRETIVAWDAKTGKAHHNALVWLDTRTADMVKYVADSSPLGVNIFRSITGLPLSTYFSLFKIKWLIDVAGVPNDSLFGTIDSFLTYRLTEGRSYLTDVTNASRYGLMDIKSLQWSKQILDFFNFKINLPNIVKNSDIIDSISHPSTPFLSGVPITALIGDQSAALLGHGCTKPGQSKITYGTGSFLLMNTGDEIRESPSGGLLTTLAFQIDQEPVYALEGSVASAGRSVKWAMDNLRIGESLSEFNSLAASVPNTAGVTFVPAFSGLFAPYWRDDARGVLVGLSLKSNFRHIARSILESTAIQVAQVHDLLVAEGGGASGRIVVDGGMTRSDLLLQIQSNLLNSNLNRVKQNEVTAFGCAYAAGHSMGFWEGKSVHEIIQNQEGYEIFEPDMSLDEREGVFTRWKDAVNRSFNLAKFSQKD